MKLIVGLGNPGSKYKNTRHNFGFRVVDALREALQLPAWEEQSNLNAWTTRGTHNGTIVVLAKPITFMNKSGDAVKALTNKYEPSGEDLIIMHDDADVPFGTAKLEENRSSGGHHGIESIITALGTNEFRRLRLGIRTPERDASDLTDYALKPFRPEEKATVETIIAEAVEVLTAQL